MIKNNRLKLLLVKYFTSFAIVLATFSNSAAQSNTDTTKKILLASANFYNKPSYILKETNEFFQIFYKAMKTPPLLILLLLAKKKELT